jgi:GNAT superfamily N-acetyltransferase
LLVSLAALVSIWFGQAGNDDANRFAEPSNASDQEDRLGIELRAPTSGDAEDCGRIIYEAFRAFAKRHGFPPDFPSLEAATQLATSFIAHPAIYGVAAEYEGKLVGSNFLTEGDPIRAVGPITIDPAAQGHGIGRQLMQAVIDRGQEAIGIRLVQDAFNTRSMSLYVSLGFEVREPLALMQGTPKSKPDPSVVVRPLRAEDVEDCAALCMMVHGVHRSAELKDALKVFTPFVVERAGCLSGYLSVPTFWIMNHGVALTEDDLRALILGAAAASSEPVSFLLPVRQASLFRWCLSEGLQVVKPMTLMSMGYYQAPQGSYFPSVLY